MTPRPWWETYPRKYWSATDYMYARRRGWKPTGAEAQRDLREKQQLRANEHLPHAAPLFTTPMEAPAAYEDRQRRQRVDKILAKHGIGRKPGPWWRL